MKKEKNKLPRDPHYAAFLFRRKLIFYIAIILGASFNLDRVIIVPNIFTAIAILLSFHTTATATLLSSKKAQELHSRRFDDQGKVSSKQSAKMTTALHIVTDRLKVFLTNLLSYMFFLVLVMLETGGLNSYLSEFFLAYYNKLPNIVTNICRMIWSGGINIIILYGSFNAMSMTYYLWTYFIDTFRNNPNE